MAQLPEQATNSPCAELERIAEFFTWTAFDQLQGDLDPNSVEYSLVGNLLKTAAAICDLLIAELDNA